MASSTAVNLKRLPTLFRQAVELMPASSLGDGSL